MPLVQPRSRKFWLILLITWLLLLLLAFAVDRAVAEWVKTNLPRNPARIVKIARRIIRLPGFYPFTLFVALLLALLHPRRWAGAVALALSGAAAGIVGYVIKWIAGRHRPVIGIAHFDFHPFPHGLIGMYSEKALCFPSGDAILAFASAASLWVLSGRKAWVFYFWAFLVAAERVLENAHYISDVVAAAGMGIIVGEFMTRRLLVLFGPEPRGFDVLEIPPPSAR